MRRNRARPSSPSSRCRIARACRSKSSSLVSSRGLIAPPPDRKPPEPDRKMRRNRARPSSPSSRCRIARACRSKSSSLVSSRGIIAPPPGTWIPGSKSCQSLGEECPPRRDHQGVGHHGGPYAAGLVASAPAEPSEGAGDDHPLPVGEVAEPEVHAAEEDRGED